MIKKEAYLYLSALLRAREPKMLSREKAERLLDAPSFAECAKQLADSGYEDMSQMNAGEIEAALSRRRAAVFRELAGMLPDEKLIDVFRVRYDYHNAKVVLKAEAVGSEPLPLMSASGRIPAETLLNAYREERAVDLPGKLAEALKAGKELLARTANPQLADFLLDKAYFAELQELCAALKSDFLTRYVSVLADSTNLRSAVRTLRMGKNADFLREALVPGGSVSAERILASASGDALASLFSGVLSDAAALGAAAAEGGPLTAFELACDNAVAKTLGEAKLVSYGEAPVIAYLAAVESEITAVRMILTGRLAGIDPQTIRERLRDLYA
ncbi:MAG: V-type ATPase subunit [Oscillospiraceae bacterium]|nr:V-type ATPase subunit [Oscillospiraceae bacterium]